MSNYRGWGRHPVTKEIQPCDWLDDYYGPHKYGAKFSDGVVYPDVDEQSKSELQSRFDMMAGHLRIIAETMLREHFGDRCPDFEPACIVCKRWKLLDDLTANPYD